MESIINKRRSKILDLKTPESKRKFLTINIVLLAGVVLIVSTLLFLLFNLNQSDKMIYKSIFFIITGLVLVMFYAVGYHRIIKKHDSLVQQGKKKTIRETGILYHQE